MCERVVCDKVVCVCVGDSVACERVVYVCVTALFVAMLCVCNRLV